MSGPVAWIDPTGQLYIGDITDVKYCSGCTVLPSLPPEDWSRWNSVSAAWEDDLNLKKTLLKEVAKHELSRTDKCMLTDYQVYKGYTVGDIADITAYRTALRSFDTIAPYDLPDIPTIIQNDPE